jgi:ribonuclease HI
VGNPGPGGWACILRYRGHEKTFVGAEDHTTNNRMEILAVPKGVRAIKHKVRLTIVTDSQYLIGAFYNPQAQNHEGFVAQRRRRGKPYKNQELLDELFDQLAHHVVIWKWVKGHFGDPDNERVDGLAEAAAASRRDIVRATQVASKIACGPLEGLAAA